MKGACYECGLVRSLSHAGAEFDPPEAMLCRRCRFDLRHEYPLGRELDKVTRRVSIA